MRIYTRTVWEWQGDQLVLTEADSHEYEGLVDYAKGGGGGGAENYENLERLYGIQADQAQFLGETFKGTVAPEYKHWVEKSRDFDSKANQELAAERAGKAVSGATSQAQQSLQENMVSLGLNPADERYQAQIGQMGIQGAAQQAAAETTARDNIRDKGFSMTQDVIGMGMGTPTQATNAASAAAKTMDTSITAQNNAQQNQANNVGNIARAGMNVWDAYSNKGADGGAVTKNGIIRLKQGGYVQRLKAGGMAGGGMGGGGAGGGFMSTPQITAPPPRRPPPPPTGGEQAASLAASPMGMKAIQTAGGKAIEAGGNAAGSPYASSLGRGLQLSPAEARTGADAFKAANMRAEQAVDKAMGAEKLSGPGYTPGSTPIPAEEGLTQLSGPGMEVGAEAGAEAATQAGAEVATEVGAEAGTEAAAAAAEAAAAEEAAALAAAEAGALGTAEAGAGMAAAATIGTAVPAIGAGLALYGIGNAAGWWADGGAVQPGGPPPPDKGEWWKKLDPAYGIDKIAKDKGWWADGGDVTPGSRDQTGEVDGPGGPKDDEVLAALSDGEFVMPIGAVKFYGIDRLEKMRQKGLEHEKKLGIT